MVSAKMYKAAENLFKILFCGMDFKIKFKSYYLFHWNSEYQLIETIENVSNCVFFSAGVLTLWQALGEFLENLFETGDILNIY